ncbi:MAG: GreA/GreB family elongation factor [Spirochaetota bacterium]
MFNTKRLITKYDYERIQKVLSFINPFEYYRSIERLKEKFKKAKFIDSRKIKPTVITMNSKFRLKNLGNGMHRDFVLVFPDDSDPKSNKISIFDDIGSEIFAHEKGEVVHLQNGEDAYYLIEDIIYQPEAAGDYNL